MPELSPAVRDSPSRPSARVVLPPLAVAVLLVAAIALGYHTLGGGPWRTHHTVGVLLVAPMLGLWLAARWTLGDAFTTRAEARTLVTRGPYRRLRHPIYVAAEGITVGLLVFTGLYWLAPVVAVSAYFQLRRARREERVLEAAFGESYRAYRARTWF